MIYGDLFWRRCLTLWAFLSVFGLPATVSAELIEVPVNVGVGPALFVITGDVQKNKSPHFGLQLDVAAIIDKPTLKKSKGKIPKKYRNQVKRLDEVRVGVLYIPDALIISPGDSASASIYGATFRPLSVGMPVGALKLSAGALLTYAYMKGDAIGGTTHFLRPGVDARAIFEVPLTESLWFSAGWSSGFYVPQTLGDDFAKAEFTGATNTVWHIGQAFAVLHYRFPYKTRL